jgi:hypothetical protein
VLISDAVKAVRPDEAPFPAGLVADAMAVPADEAATADEAAADDAADDAPVEDTAAEENPAEEGKNDES